MAKRLSRAIRYASCAAMGAAGTFYHFRLEIMAPDAAVRRLHDRQLTAMKAAIASHTEKHRLMAKDQIRKSGIRLRHALHNYKMAVEERRLRKMGKAASKIALNVLTFGAAEGVSAVVDMAEMVIDVADAVCDGSDAGVAGALLDGVVDFADFAGAFDAIQEGDLGELLVDLVDIGTEVCKDWEDWTQGFDKISQVQRNLIRLEESMLKGPVRNEGVELIRAVAEMLILLEQFNIVASAEQSFAHLLEFHLGRC